MDHTIEIENRPWQDRACIEPKTAICSLQCSRLFLEDDKTRPPVPSDGQPFDDDETMNSENSEDFIVIVFLSLGGVFAAMTLLLILLVFNIKQKLAF